MPHVACLVRRVPSAAPCARVLAIAALVVAVAGAGACRGDAPAFAGPPLPAPVPPPLDVSGWVSALEGAMPLVLVAPHGGELSPDVLPDRRCTGCETANDANTQELALEIASAFERRVGRRPFVVINRLHRRKFDANRERVEATASHAPLDAQWAQWHQQIDSAKARALRVHARALLVDLHGHAHGIARLELGYLLSASALRLADSALGPLVGGSSVSRLSAQAISGDRGATLVRGARALGTRLAAAGYPSVPSAADPAPNEGDAYFSGGYNTERHGSRAGGAVDAVQLECNYAGVRDTPADRAAFAEALVSALLAFLDDQYGWRAPA